MTIEGGIRIVAPGPKGYGAIVTNAATGEQIPGIADISIRVPVDDIIRAEMVVYLTSIDVVAGEAYKFVICPECRKQQQVEHA